MPRATAPLPVVENAPTATRSPFGNRTRSDTGPPSPVPSGTQALPFHSATLAAATLPRPANQPPTTKRAPSSTSAHATGWAGPSASADHWLPFQRARFATVSPPAVANVPPTSRSPLARSSATGCAHSEIWPTPAPSALQVLVAGSNSARWLVAWPATDDRMPPTRMRPLARRSAVRSCGCGSGVAAKPGTWIQLPATNSKNPCSVAANVRPAVTAIDHGTGTAPPSDDQAAPFQRAAPLVATPPAVVKAPLTSRSPLASSVSPYTGPSRPAPTCCQVTPFQRASPWIAVPP